MLNVEDAVLLSCVEAQRLLEEGKAYSVVFRPEKEKLASGKLHKSNWETLSTSAHYPQPIKQISKVVRVKPLSGDANIIGGTYDAVVPNVERIDYERWHTPNIACSDNILAEEDTAYVWLH
jgi:hypothetical protein